MPWPRPFLFRVVSFMKEQDPATRRKSLSSSSSSPRPSRTTHLARLGETGEAEERYAHREDARDQMLAGVWVTVR
ncbi:hypothetical protein E2C01_014259 [Portunus trituberculatus]|uniref:Uncharacterized protein n=1 Tax=Portunus trituberculatus TaxID=210409 RepID=A0A5B7DIQ3_PORTR|nr:hypothetical protein [Portunus trituberculatus]